MTNEEHFGQRLKRAIGYVPPSPGFGTRALTGFVPNRSTVQAEERHGKAGWLALVAALLAVAIVVTLVGARALHVMSPTPVRPVLQVPPLLKTTPLCTGRTAGLDGETDWFRMFTPSTGWALGPFHTIDGGKQWRFVGPTHIPYQTFGNGETEFFMDSTRAWVVEVGGSAGVTADHVVVFGTTDSGVVWRQSPEIALKPARPGDAIWVDICFTDTANGFLFMASGQGSMAGGIATTLAALYRTTDGGMHWKWVSDPDAEARKSGTSCWFDGGGMVFSSETDGWIGADCPGFLVTHDGGSTWSIENSATIAYFFDSTHGVVEQPGFIWPPPPSQTRYPIAVTADGGSTWVTRGSVPDPNCIATFVDPLHGWCLINSGATNPESGTPIEAQIYNTSDGGHTWSRPVAVQTYLSSAELDFLDAKTGFLGTGGSDLSGQQGPTAADWQFFKTTDGGLTWTRVDSATGF
jgi:photosystem II stability/assembly factor-like uncharacterized protein